jgi:hypothetical protein
MPYVTYRRGYTSDRECKKVKDNYQASLTVKRWMAAYVDSCVDFIVSKEDAEQLEELWNKPAYLEQLIYVWNKMFSLEIQYFPDVDSPEEEIKEYNFPAELKDPANHE